MYQVRRGLRAAVRICERLDRSIGDRMLCDADALTEQYRRNMIRVSREYNMATHPDEPYYREQYWHWIEPFLDRHLPRSQEKPQMLVDLGCGQGRLSVPLAQWCCMNASGGNVHGVDLSGLALDFARRFADENGVGDRTRFEQKEALEWLVCRESASVQVIVCTEVLYTVANYRDILDEASRVLVPGGLFVGAFRSRYYNLLHALQTRSWSALPVIVSETDGYPWGPPTRFSWFNCKELTDLLSRRGMSVTDMRGIGICSGTEGDPLADLVRPSTLMPAERKRLMDAELALSDEMADCGRYLLALAIKGEKRPDRGEAE